MTLFMSRQYSVTMTVQPEIGDPTTLLKEGAKAVQESEPSPKKIKKEMPPKKVDIVRKQKRVMALIDDDVVQEKLKKKVATKRAKADSEKVTKAGGDDTRPLRASKKAKKSGGDKLSDTSAKTKSVRSRNAK